MVNRKRYSRAMSIVIAVAMVFSVMVFMPEDVSAAAKKPGKVTITKATKMNQMITVTWKKTKNAKKYQVYAKAGKGKWKRVATVKSNGKAKQTYKIKKCKWNTKYQIKMRAVNGKKKGGWSKTYQGKLAKKTTLQKFVASKAPIILSNMQRDANSYDGMTGNVAIKGNTIMLQLDVIGNFSPEDIDALKVELRNAFLSAKMKNDLRANMTKLENTVGIFGIKYNIKVYCLGNLLFEHTY